MGQLLFYTAINIVRYTIQDNISCLCDNKLKEPVCAAI